MKSPAQRSRVDDDGVRTATGPTRTRVLGIVLVLAAIAVIAASASAVWWLRRDPGVHTTAQVATSDDELPQRIPAPVRAIPKQPPAAQPTTAMRTQSRDRAANAARRAAAATRSATAPAAAGGAAPPPAVGLGAAVVPEEQRDAETARLQQSDDRALARTAQEVINGMRASGETKGLAAIPPPGTNPVKSGLVVPEDFELPAGYVRHYQTTDDGKRLEAILMFSPDYEFVDEQGTPIPVPEDGIVPPEMAPPGMPLRTLKLPAAHEKNQ